MNWPKPGDKLKVKDVIPEHFYPAFTNIIKDGRDNLHPGEEYTVEKCEIYSSWCAVWLKELPSKDEKDRLFHLSFFDWKY